MELDSVDFRLLGTSFPRLAALQKPPVQWTTRNCCCCQITW